MNVPDVSELNSTSDSRYSAMLALQAELNRALSDQFEAQKDQGPDALASLVLSKVEALVAELNANGYGLGRSDYGGDVNFEQSEQLYSNGRTMGSGLIIHFLGFTAQVSWEPD